MTIPPLNEFAKFTCHFEYIICKVYLSIKWDNPAETG